LEWYRAMSLWKRTQVYKLSWARFDGLLDSLELQIRQSGFIADVVVGLCRGGLPAAVSLSNRLNIPNFGCISLRRNTTASWFSARSEPHIDWYRLPQCKGQVLLVDDIVGSGETLRACTALLRNRGFREMRIAAVVVNTNGGNEVDYCGTTVDDWVIFPWEPALPPRDLQLPIVEV
jgi:uncharacterized protein